MSPHPALQLRGELGLKLAGCPLAVVSLDEHFVSQRRAVPQLLQIVELETITQTCGQIKGISHDHAVTHHQPILGGSSVPATRS